MEVLTTIGLDMIVSSFFIICLDDDSAVCVGVSRGGQSCGSIPGSLIDSAGYASQGQILMGGDGNFAAEKFKKGL